MPKCWQDVEKPDDSYVADEGMKLFSHSGKQFSGFFKKKIKLSYNSAIVHLGIYPEK